MQSRNDGLDFGLPPDSESHDWPQEYYDRLALELGRRADEKFKGQKLRREAKKFAIFCLELSIAWAIVTVWLWLGVTLFLTKFNALDHLANIGWLDWLELGAFATGFIYMMVKTFRFALEE